MGRERRAWLSLLIRKGELSREEMGGQDRERGIGTGAKRERGPEADLRMESARTKIAREGGKIQERGCGAGRGVVGTLEGQRGLVTGEETKRPQPKDCGGPMTQERSEHRPVSRPASL